MLAYKKLLSKIAYVISSVRIQSAQTETLIAKLKVNDKAETR